MTEGLLKSISLEEISSENIVFFTYASLGAMGDSGAIDLYSVQSGQVCHFYANMYSGFDPKDIVPYLPRWIRYDEKMDSFNGACEFGGGMGNHFFINPKYRGKFMMMRLGKSDSNYRGWEDTAEILLKEIAEEQRATW